MEVTTSKGITSYESLFQYCEKNKILMRYSNFLFASSVHIMSGCLNHFTEVRKQDEVAFP